MINIMNTGDWIVLIGLLSFALLNVIALFYGIVFNIVHYKHKRNGINCRCEWIVKYDHNHKTKNCPVCRFG